MRYVSLMGSRKPHLLIKTINNLGAETRVAYASSTKFLLQDKRDGKPWITRLPFPVHVVEQVETLDHISRNRFVTCYAYHHGYYDGEEREFRGFGMVEQWDTQQFAALAEVDFLAENVSADSHVPPVHTKTWFHTGVCLDRDHVSDYFAGLLTATDEGEYFREPGLTDDQARSLLLPDTILPPDLTAKEEREACRALKSSMLRQEVYALDGAGRDPSHPSGLPYTVTEQNFTIRPLQPRGGHRHAVFFTHAREAVSFHSERNPADPRVQHALTFEVDAYGNVLRHAAIGYGRRRSDASLPTEADRDQQVLVHIAVTENRLTEAITNDPDNYRTPMPAETRTYELRKSEQEKSEAGLTKLHLFEELRRHVQKAADGAHDIGYEDLAFARARQVVAADPSGREKHRYFRRLVEKARTLHRKDDLNALLPLGQLEALGLAGESYQLAFTGKLIASVFRRPATDGGLEQLLPDPASALAGNEGGYLQSRTLKMDGRFPSDDPDDEWWVPSGRHYFSEEGADELAQARKHFFLPRRYRDPFGEDSVITHDSPHKLLLVETRDALGNRVTVSANDYRVLQPRLVTDPNGNQSEVAFDALGMVVGSAVMGKATGAAAEGDTLANFVADLPDDDLEGFFEAAEPQALAAGLLKGATTRMVYDLERFRRSRLANPTDSTLWQPVCAASLVRETHARSALPPQGLKIQVAFSYSDGFGREIQRKIQAEPGPLIDGGPVVSSRWVAGGWAIFNNKGKPVREYEPFFSRRPRSDGTFVSDHHFEFGMRAGVSTVLFYDPAGRVVATLHPNHTYEKVVFNPWERTTYDVNDTCAPRNAQSGDPRTDPDIAGCVARYFASQPADWQTWHARRIDNTLGEDERSAALYAEAHADTPRRVHFDSLGRTFLTVLNNRVVCPGHDLDGTEDLLTTRVELDAEGNQRAIRDAVQQAGDPLGRIVMRYAYDMLGHRIHQASMEAGARWLLNDATGKTLRTWDSRGHVFTTTYDALRRPLTQHVRGTSSHSDPRTLNQNVLVDRIEYGEPPPNAPAAEEQRAQKLNLRTRIYRHFDSAGVLTYARLDDAGQPVAAYDFKGNVLHTTRRLASDYRTIPDWSQNPPLESESFENATRYDALNRPTQLIAPHSNLARAKRNVIQPVFNEANLLERVDVWMERATEPSSWLDPANDAPSAVGVANIDYDASGRRLRIAYKNGASTRYRYDPETFRLVHLYSRRGGSFTEDCDNPMPPPPTIAAPETPPEGKSCGLQNLRYTYDAAGNITRLKDDAQQTIYFRNRRIEPGNDFVYDALYRLVQAGGREHLGQAANGDPQPPAAPDAFNSFHTRHDQPGDRNAMGTYIERYNYDAAGNFLQMQHRGSDPQHPGWTRSYEYLEASSLAGEGVPVTGNRLTRTTLNAGGNAPQPESYLHDVHGNMTRMPHLGGAAPNLYWNGKDQLARTDLGGGGVAFHVYDATGQRVRKVWEKAPGLTEERLYLGGFEIFRKYSGPPAPENLTLERETLHVMDDAKRIALVETRSFGSPAADSALRQMIRYQFGNHLGSISLELDEEAQIISYEEYAPYGSSTFQAVRSQTETAKRYRYTGKERDEESGLYYHGARYFAPHVGRWISCDPASLADGLNLYRYCSANPIGLSDPTGLFGWNDIKQGAAAAYDKAKSLNPKVQQLNEDLGRVNRALDLLNPGAAAIKGVTNALIENTSQAATGKTMASPSQPAKKVSTQKRIEAANDALMTFTPLAPVHHIGKAITKAAVGVISGQKMKSEAALDVAKAEPTGLVSKAAETEESLEKAGTAQKAGKTGAAVRGYIDAGIGFVEFVNIGVSLFVGGVKGPKGPGGGGGGGGGGGSSSPGGLPSHQRVPAITYGEVVDRGGVNVSVPRTIYVVEGNAYYVSTGQAAKLPGQIDKGTGNAFRIWGVQEADMAMGQGELKKGWVGKQTLENDLTPAPTPAQESVVLDFQGNFKDPADVNAWLRQQGVNAPGSIPNKWP
jgi:RHS repeat-associated protein